ncbi:MAG: hypothetical protein H0X66_15445 [Verrucomicrobia bacterium]|nr:hypothetical protein [Verrucomicrobiota bacterium]
MTTPEVQPDETLVCENCGKHGAIQFGDLQLCEECYQNMGSCCPEFGGFDLWDVDETLQEQPLRNQDSIA